MNIEIISASGEMTEIGFFLLFIVNVPLFIYLFKYFFRSEEDLTESIFTIFCHPPLFMSNKEDIFELLNKLLFLVSYILACVCCFFIEYGIIVFLLSVIS